MALEVVVAHRVVVEGSADLEVTREAALGAVHAEASFVAEALLAAVAHREAASAEDGATSNGGFCSLLLWLLNFSALWSDGVCGVSRWVSWQKIPVALDTCWADRLCQ